MSIRQIRISSREAIQARITEFQGKPVHLVLTDRTSVAGVLKVVENKEVTIVNARLRKMTIAIADISEIYFDQNV